MRERAWDSFERRNPEPILPIRRIRKQRRAPETPGGPLCHGTTCIITGTNHLHPLTITWVLITNTCNHLPLPFISSLTSVTHRLISRLHSALHWSLSAYLPVHPGSRFFFTYSVYCTSGFQSLLRYISNVGSPAWVIVNKSPFDLHLPLCLFDQLVTPLLSKMI